MIISKAFVIASCSVLKNTFPISILRIASSYILMPSVADEISAYTLFHKEQLWMDNIAENLVEIRGGRGCNEMLKLTGPIVIVGAGPSVERFKLLDSIKKDKDALGATIVTTDKMLIPCLEANLMPDYVVTVDGSPIIEKFYDSKLIDTSLVKAILATHTHPSVIKRFKGDKYWFNVAYESERNLLDGSLPHIDRAVHWLTKKPICPGLGNAGAIAWSLAGSAGASPIVICGLDYSYGTELDAKKTLYWGAYKNKYGLSDAETFDKCYRRELNPWGHDVLTDEIWDHYKGFFFQAVKTTKIHTVNVSPYSILHGTNIETRNWDGWVKTFTK